MVYIPRDKLEKVLKQVNKKAVQVYIEEVGRLMPGFDVLTKSQRTEIR